MGAMSVRLYAKTEHSEDSIIFTNKRLGGDWVYVCSMSEKAASWLRWVGGFGRNQRLRLRSPSPLDYARSRVEFAKGRIGAKEFFYE